ncbi:hypothetical protein L210DRAFT_3555312 [Boletus edulis BED1]|uniref:Uncharacterized protein n=1 Tax=Boletus edulis BED1 TaxID=1328754 RepID=A0AAD4BLV8_BOLED|nr:hypothetical protein L210DRAFT_3555312 [Boletus edulis BED1]
MNITIEIESRTVSGPCHQYNIITRRLREVLGVIKGILAREGRSPKAYWGEPLQPDTTSLLDALFHWQ